MAMGSWFHFGSKVRLHFKTPGMPPQDCTLLNTPQGPGDMLVVKDETDSIFAVNPYASSFFGMELLLEETDNEQGN